MNLPTDLNLWLENVESKRKLVPYRKIDKTVLHMGRLTSMLIPPSDPGALRLELLVFDPVFEWTG
jgi:hypothetical protein